MSVTIRPGNPQEPAATALLRTSHALMQSLFPPEDNHYLSIDALLQPHIRFFIAERDGETIGCAALSLQDNHAELKSMFVDPAARGTGAAHALMHRLEAEARAAGFTTLRLETGNTLHAAHRLYIRHGFQPRGPFGDYQANGTSVFMEKVLR